MTIGYFFHHCHLYMCHSFLIFLYRTPPLTLLHISASKLNDAPSAGAGGIAGFLSSDVNSNQAPT